MDYEIISPIVDFIREIFAGLNSGLLLFGGPADIVRYIIDILLITVVLYNLLRVLRETRAWQLLKGVLLIVLLTMICSLFGLEMVSFIFNKILYVVAIAFVVIFQPELRRALETVGLKSFSPLSVAFAPEYQDPQHILSNAIDETVNACMKMGKAYTGALIILERNSKLSELMMQENAVKLDSSVTATMLQSIFYKGSPLHDGAILVRSGRIIAARCHVPLADNYHVREDLGTRHRAAIGASEMGDAVAIAVSEERGTVSIALAGCLYVMQNADDLRSNLRYLLGVSNPTPSFGQRIRLQYNRRIRKSKKSDAPSSVSDKEEENAFRGVPDTCSVSTSAARTESDTKTATIPASRMRRGFGAARYQKTIMFLVSLLVSLGLWMYIQITTNPIAQKSITVKVMSVNTEILSERGLEAYYPVATVTVDIVGRKTTIDKFSESDLSAYIDFSDVKESGIAELPIRTTSEISAYFRVEQMSKDQINVVISPLTN